MNNPVSEGPVLQDVHRIISQELFHLWTDLVYAMQRTKEWSKECESLEQRIKRLTPLVGPTSWQQVNIKLLEFGIYQRIHEDIGITVAVDMEKVAEAKAMLEEQLNQRSPTSVKQQGVFDDD